MSVYRVDKFKVPDAARQEFLARVRKTHDLLERLPGYEQGAILEQVGGPGQFNLVTIAVWQSPGVVEEARRRVRESYEAEGFDPQALMQRLGVEADMADYEPLGDA